MTKLLKEGRRDLTLGKISILFILFPILNFFPQQVINNFGISENFKTNPGYSKFTFIDFNNDNISDLFLFGNQRKSFTIHEGLEEHKYSVPTSKFFFFPIDDFGWLTKSERGDDYYIFVSRNRRLAGLVSFTKSFSLQLLNTFNFNSYPSSLKIVDLDKNGKNEALVFGNNFDGVLLLRNEGFRLVADTLYKQRVFSDVDVLDFSQDEVDDLIVIDALYNSVNFLENTEIGGFFSTRVIEFDETLYSSQLLDLNSDSIPELIIGKENGVKIFFGDSVFSYSEAFNSDFNFTPVEFAINDINSDSKKDIISINSFNNTANIDLDLMEESKNIEWKFPGISDLELKTYPTGTAIYFLSKKGNFKIATDQKQWGNDFNLSIGGTPNKFVHLTSEEVEDSFIVVSHIEESFLSSIRIDKKGRFSIIKTIPFVNKFEEYISEPEMSKIAGYTNKRRLIEIVNLNVEDDQYGPSKYLYTKFPINKVCLDDESNLELLESSKDTLLHGIMETKDGIYEAEKPEIIDTNVFESIKTSSGIIYYWNSDTNNVYLNSHFNDKSNVLITLSKKDTISLGAVIIENQAPNSKKIFTILKQNDSLNFYIVEDEDVFKFESRTDFIPFSESDSVNIKYYSGVEKNDFLSIHREKLEMMEFYDLDRLSKRITLTNTIDGIQLNDYFIRKYLTNNYLIYTNKENYSISFKILDQ